MPIRVCISAFGGYRNNMGGLIWTYLDWALSLQAVGCEVIWLELGRASTEADSSQLIRDMEVNLAGLGLQCRVLYRVPGESCLVKDSLGQVLPLADIASEIDLFLNLAYCTDAETVRSFRRTLFFDMDPGLVQLWINQGSLTLPEHDLYLTLGERVAAGDACVPDCGIAWHYQRPPVYLPAWPVAESAPDAPFTTVTNWWGKNDHGWIYWGGEHHNNEKRTSFLEYLELPDLVDVPLELAVSLTESLADNQERERLEKNGWRVMPTWNLDWTPKAYREYVRQSRGEFSCAKPMYSRLNTGIIFPRTLHYLASGKPAVVQHVGPVEVVPSGVGLYEFRNIEEARRGFDSIGSDYERHAKAARGLVEENFDGRQVAREILNRALN